MTRRRLILTALLAGLAGAAMAQDGARPQGKPQAGQGGEQQGEPKEHRHGPPPEALQACKSLAAGAACGFTGQRGAMKGQCWAPQGKPLACRPADAQASTHSNR